MNSAKIRFNASGADVDISGWAVEYGSATGSWGSSSTNYFVFPADTWIIACSYLMISCGTSGKVGLFNAPNANLADFTIVTNPVPRNSASPAVDCGPVPNDAGSWGGIKALYR